MKRLFTITIIFLMIFELLQGQNILISQGGTVNVSGGEMFYDAGGPAGNDGNTDYTITLCPSVAGEAVALDFTYFKTMWVDGWVNPEEDPLYIYDGNTVTGSDIGKLMGDYTVKYNTGVTPYGMGVEAFNANPLIGTPTIFAATNPTGCLTLVFDNNEVGTYSGWEAEVITFKPMDTPGCNISLTADIDHICPGDPLMLYASGSVVSAPINNDFNSGSIGTGWASTASASFQTNACGYPSLDGSLYFWMANAAGPRSLETNTMDVSNGGTISFEYRQARNNGASSPCECPDQGSGTFEGVYVQYSTNGGSTWTTFKYIYPNGTEGSFGAEAGLTGCGDYVKEWTKMTYPIPAAAQTANTKFRWLQDKVTSSTTDNWGLDNVIIATPLSSTLTIEDLSTGTIILTTNNLSDSVQVNPLTTTTYRATITDGITSCSQDFTVTIDACTIPTCGSCTTPDCPIAGPFADAAEADNAQCNWGSFSGGDFYQLSPAATNTTYTSYHEVTTGNTGEVGIVVSTGQQGNTGFPTACDAATKTATLYAASPCTAGAIIPTATNASPVNGYYNPEWTGLLPNTTYILVIEYTVPANCELQDHCVTFYAPNASCTCTAPCTMDEVQCFDNRVYDGLDVETVAAGATETFCYTINSGPNGFIGLVQQYGGTPASDIRSAVLHTVGDCATDINPSPTNANGVGSGFNPEWSGLTPNTDYIACITIENTGWIDADVDPVSYWAPSCCNDDVGTQNPGLTGSGTADLVTNTFTLCNGDVFDITTTGAVPSVDYAIYNCAPTSDDPATDACYTGYWFEQLNSMSETSAGDASAVLSFLNSNGVSFTNNTIWWVPITTDAIGMYDPACYDMDFNNMSYQVTYLNALEATGVENCTTGVVTVTITGGSPEYVTSDVYSITNNGSGVLSATNLNTSGGTITITGLNDGDTYDITISDDNGCSYNYTGGPFLDCNCNANAGTTTVEIDGSDVTNGSNTYTLCWGQSIDFINNADFTLPDPASTDPNGLGYALFSSLPTNLSNPELDPAFLGFDYNPNTGDVNNGGGFPVGTYYIAPITFDDICNIFPCDAARGYDVDGDACWDMGIVLEFTFLPEIIADAGADVTLTCTNTSFILDASGSTSNGLSLSYLWTGPGIVSGANTATPTVNQAGIYTLTISTPEGCSDTDQLEVFENTTAPTADAGADMELTCAITDLNLDGSASTGGMTYAWTTSGGNIVSGSNTTSPNINQTGTYTISVTDPANGCSASDNVTVTANTTAPTADAGADMELTCAITDLNLDGSASTGGMTYVWTTAGGNIVSGSNTTTPNINQTGTYTISVTDPSNGCSAIDNVTVTANTTAPTADAGADMELTCAITDLNLNGSASTGGMTYAWITSGGNIVSGASTMSPNINQTGTYTISVTDP
ncbi:MAG: hypothetical protein JXR60_08360, partial [Bacteroidales bacterium]|nr:hypothetical protein [Bacteroidales bacterium]